MKERFVVIEEDNEPPVIREIGHITEDYTTLQSIVDKLNEQYQTIIMWCKKDKKITDLLIENTKPTAYDGGDVFLDIDLETKRCKYENTIICYNCEYHSSYFLDCRLMMEDCQYKKAKSLGLIKGD